MADKTFTVACLGASAGGLDACKSIIRGIPADAGLAIVLINHARRHPQLLLLEILARAAAMPVQLITDDMPLERNHVYVIPPNRDLLLRKGAFRLSAISKRQGWPNVISLFLESLANWTGQSVAIVLSGMGPDGADALRSVKAAGGLTFAQTPDTAEYPCMPRNAIATGFVDFTLSPEAIAWELLRIHR